MYMQALIWAVDSGFYGWNIVVNPQHVCVKVTVVCVSECVCLSVTMLATTLFICRFKIRYHQLLYGTTVEPL